MHNTVKVTLIVFLALLSLNAYAEDNTHQLDVSVGYGHGHFGSVFSSHKSYNPVMFMLHYAIAANKTAHFLANVPKRWMFYLEPGYSFINNKRSEKEIGLGAGVQYMFDISKKVKGYFFLGSGLIYITYKSDYQKEGLNFQDNIGSGLLFFISKNKALNAGVRFRHVSNGGIKQPNHGINDFIGTVGVSLFF